MKRIGFYLKNYKKESVLGPLFKLLEAFFDLMVPLVMASIIDTGIENDDMPYVVKLSLVLVALAVIGLICSVTAQYFSARAAVGFATRLRHDLFGHIQSLSYTEIDTIGTSTLITRMTSDINQVQNGVNMCLRLLLRSPFIVFGAMILAFTIDVKAALVFAVTIPVLVVIVYGIMLITMPMYKNVQTGLDRVLGRTRENLTGVRIIRAFNKEESETESFSGENLALNKSQRLAGRVSGLTNPLTYVVINLATVFLLYTSGVRIDAGGLTQGQLIAMVNYMTQILVELVKLANLIVTLTKAMACFGRIETVLDTRSSMEYVEDSLMQDRSCGAGGALGVDFKHVSLTYAGAGAKSLQDISFTAPKGSVVGVIGGTGSGKTSLVSLIPRFYDATEGSVSIDGIDVKAYPKAVLRDKIGIVPQKSLLFAGTIRDNLLWGNEAATDEELWEALQISQGEEFVQNKLGGLDAQIEQGGKNLSGGQKQRLAIARAMVKKPEILIMDDSASALDFATDAALRHAIQSMADAPTMFIVSQRASSIQFADLILVLEDGACVDMGTHEELLAKSDTYREIYESQFKKPEVDSHA
ncbi:MAG: ABC transporter ATP-binding protein/permease [Lachnospiraceae bacterium]|nr:ABC transporter ATP-binding protein/permease [Lachnospiraceae bacterium]